MTVRKHTKVIECQALRKSYFVDSREIPVLRGVDFEVRSGEYVILFGPSGCGKSTLLHIIAGLEPITAGKVYLRSKDISTFSPKELARLHRTKIGLVFQQFSFFKTLNVLENVCLPRFFTPVPPRLRIERARYLLKIFGIDYLAEKYPQELSGGEQQRLALARSLVNNPWILLIDEPTGNLDKKSGNEIMSIIYQLNHISHRTILLVTHNQDYLHFAHRVLYMEDGRIIKEQRNHPLRFWHPLPGAEKLKEEHLEKI